MELPFVLKYKPSFFNQFIGNSNIKEILDNLTSVPNLLFFGPAGTGKTTAAHIIKKKYFSPQSVLELNASDDRGINVVREKIKPFCETKTLFDRQDKYKYKLIILDEVDSMTKDAQNALRILMEDYTNIRFCLICNYIKKIQLPIISRCSVFRFNLLKREEILIFLKNIFRAEKITAKETDLFRLIDETRGDMRKLLNDISGILAIYGNINQSILVEYYGNEINDEVFKNLILQLRSGNRREVFKYLSNTNINNILSNITEYSMVQYLAEIEIEYNSGRTKDELLICILSQMIILSKILKIYYISLKVVGFCKLLQV